jgi:hypothetical protein
MLFLSGLSGHVNSQVNADADASIAATIVEPVSLSRTLNTDFGNVAIIFTGTVEMTPAGIPSKKGGIVLPVPRGTFTAAIYSFTGPAGYTVTVSYPTSPFKLKSGSNAVQVASMSDIVSTAGSNLIAGVFVSVSPSNVTVNYN